MMPFIRQMLRTALTVTLAASLLVAMPGLASAGQGFRDDDGNIHENSIEALSNAGITQGCGTEEFCPDKAVTRGQMAAFLDRALSLPPASGVEFDDDDGSIFEGSIERIAAVGITKGCNPPANTNFCPESFVTRGQMAAFLVRALNLTDTGSASFADDDGSIFETDIEKLAQAGITQGCNPPANDQFCPYSRVTRAQMATFLTRALDLPTQPPPGFALGNEDRALVTRYESRRDTSEGQIPDIYNARYSPRSFTTGLDVLPDPDDVDLVNSPGRYDGWDVLSPSTRWEHLNRGPDPDWFRFTLSRDARVGVVWRSDETPPGWLSGWTKGGTVIIDDRIHDVYEKDFAAGEIKLGSVEGQNGWRRMYLVLLAETDGTPTPTPPAPEGWSTPLPNRPCSAWVHDLNTTVAPDGESYVNWHPQIDPVYWCSYGHDHGSDPAIIPGNPLVGYGYVAAAVPQVEPHGGFKEFIMESPDGDYWLRFIIHAGTAFERRICARFHTLFIMVYDKAGNEKFSVGYKNDYGTATDSDGNVLTPTDCGYSMPALANEVSDRQKRTINVGAASDNYERWDSRFETDAVRNLGMVVFEHEFDVINPISACTNRTCNDVVVRDLERFDATRRQIFLASWRGDFEFDADHALGQGEYFTDPFAQGLVDASASNALRQYVEPGFKLTIAKNATANRIGCVSWDPWSQEFICYQTGGSGNRENIPFPPRKNLEYGIWRD